VLGERSGIDREQWEVLTRTGTNHLVAISGLHVGLVAAMVFFLGRWAWSRSVHLAGRLAAPRAAALAALAGAFGYSALAGFAVSTQRALIMSAVVLGALILGRTVRPASGLALALVGVLAVDPMSLLSFGFWLSFGAVMVLLYAMGGRLADRGIWRRWGHAQWAVAVGLLPMLLLLFGRASVVAPLVNLVAVPLFSLLLLPLVLVASLLALLPGLDLPLVLTARLLGWCLALLQTAADWEWAAIHLSGRPGWVWAAAFAGAFLLLAPRGLPGRWLGLILVLPLVLVRPPAPAPGEAWFSILDVGQGLAALVRTHEHTLLYDTGPSFPSGFNTGRAVVLPFLRAVGVERIDTLVLSHADRDHVGGLTGLVGAIPIDRILAGDPGRIAEVRAEPCRSGERWVWEGVEMAVLHPDGSGYSDNDGSCVLRVRTAGAGVLLPGDIEAGVEQALVGQGAEALASAVLVAAHHGSATSSTRSFLEAVGPRWVVYSSGFGNRFGFPSVEVRRRVAETGAEELNTATAGMIGFRLHRGGLEGPMRERRDHPRPWRRPVAVPGGAF
jgi:competence protein ComEC